MADLTKDYSDWVTKKTRASINVRATATEDAHTKVSVDETREMEVSEYVERLVTLAPGTSVSVGTLLEYLRAAFVFSSGPVSVSLISSVHQNVTFFYADFNKNEVDIVVVSNSGTAPVTVSVLALKE